MCVVEVAKNTMYELPYSSIDLDLRMQVWRVWIYSWLPDGSDRLLHDLQIV